jgi:succinate dehydrogenase hydrophobic anchor subunit
MKGMVIKPKQHEGTWLWLAKIFAGLLIVIVLSIHYVVNHILAPGGLLSYADVIRYYNYPLVPLMEVIFLILVVFHALVGTRSIILDLNPSTKILGILNWVFIIMGGFAIIYGTWLVIVIVNLG